MIARTPLLRPNVRLVYRAYNGRACGHRNTSTPELMIEYKGGSQKVAVPENVPVFTTVPAERSLLVPGAYVVTTARAGVDGVLFTQRIAVSKDGARPAN